MAESSSTCLGMPETEITALKEALCAQQQLLQKLYIELDQEREASASATSEALSMILRLQGEKAAVTMESSQYKRMVEEKMYHAEESLAVFEDLMYQKEMEIASLEFQVQAYRCKLLSMGSSDPENLLLQRNEVFAGDMGVHGTVRRNNSLPSMRLKDSYHKKGMIERERSAILGTDLIPMIVEENTDWEFNERSMDSGKKPENYEVGDFDSYWEQIRRLDERVKEMSDYKDPGRGIKSTNLSSGSRSCSLNTQLSSSTLYDPTRGTITAKLDQIKHPENLLEPKANSAYSSSIHDIFEVPQTYENRKGCGQRKKEQSKLILEDESRLGKPDSVTQEALESYVKDEIDGVKKMLLCALHENKLSNPRDGTTVDCDLACVHPTIGVAESQAQFQQLNRRMERLEDQRTSITQESSVGGEEEMKLLKEIREQLNSIESEIRRWRTKKSPPPDDTPLLSVMEAMLYFWL